MSAKIKRPPAIWLTQLLFAFFALFWLFILTNGLIRIARNGLSEDMPAVRPIIASTVILGFIIMLLISFWGLAQRKVYGRWLGVTSLILLWGLILYTQIYPSAGPWKRHEFNSPAERAGGVIGQTLISALFLILILRLAFAGRVNEFFRGDNNRVEQSNHEAA